MHLISACSCSHLIIHTTPHHTIFMESNNPLHSYFWTSPLVHVDVIILFSVLGGLVPQNRLLDYSLALNYNVAYTFLLTALIAILPRTQSLFPNTKFVDSLSLTTFFITLVTPPHPSLLTPLEWWMSNCWSFYTWFISRVIVRVVDCVKWGVVLGMLHTVYLLFDVGPSFHAGFGLSAAWDPFMFCKSPLEWSLAVVCGN
jgi:hypothetical protein